MLDRPVVTLSCPKCHAVMRPHERQGVVIDLCTECRGIFLDRGELDRLLDLEAGQASRWSTADVRGGRGAEPWMPGGGGSSWRARDDDDDRDGHGLGRWRDDNRHRDDDGRSRRRRGGLLGELLDAIGD